MMVKPQGQVHHLNGFGNDLGAAAEAGQEMADVAVVPLDGEGRILAGEELVPGNDPVVPFPVVGDEGFALDPYLVEEPSEGPVVTASQYPCDGTAGDGVVRTPNPELFHPP